MKKDYFILKTLIFIVLIFLIVNINSCKDTKNKIPPVHVDIEIPLSDPLYNNLTVLGGHVNIKGGYRGILIYHTVSNEYRAYDRACPYDPDCGKVSYIQANYRAVDTICCNSEFDMLNDGIVAQGPAEFPLRSYRCIYDENANILYIKN